MLWTSAIILQDDGILEDAKYINVNWKYGPIVHEKWEICSNKTTKSNLAHFRKEKNYIFRDLTQNFRE